ncbi:alpha/beta fold hydrolase [Sabulicella rubraurantiaca]|uniref:alpha/beta fold hydrolase n=1 Tax=Sabulicella rubraurantiaca TaxID=2811429 RepID=UPI001A979501|nr:alpha/beta fold hydrolase [Sabulicella rubraurantiaca]
MARPQTRYARNGEVHLAYQVVGNGPVDLVYVPGFINNLDLQWEHEGYAHLLSRLASFSRLILFDKRGTGLSDPVTEAPTLEQRMDDVRAIMDAVGSERAFLVGASEGGAMTALFAATYPERTRGLVLYGAYPSFAAYVSGPEKTEQFLADIEAGWGTGMMLERFDPVHQFDPDLRAWWSRHERLGASPRMAQQLVRMNASIDIRPILPAIRVPTLVLHRAGDTWIGHEAGPFLEAHIPAARLVTVPGDAHPIWMGDVAPVADEIEAFVTGQRPSAPLTVDRVLATVLVAEIADPERGAAALGDAVWCARLDRWRAEANAVLAAKSGVRPGASLLSDGTLLASFDGPARAVRCAVALREAAQRLLDRGLRCGLHVGEVAAAPLGEAGANAGLALHVARRVAALAAPGEVLVSGTVRDLVAGSGLRFREREARLPLGPEAGGVRLPLLAFAADDAAALGPPVTGAPVPTAPPGDALPAGLAELSPREREVLRLMARGLSNPAIAASLGVSENTVKRQAANVLLKLGAPSRTAAAALAIRAGLA